MPLDPTTSALDPLCSSVHRLYWHLSKVSTPHHCALTEQSAATASRVRLAKPPLLVYDPAHRRVIKMDRWRSSVLPDERHRVGLFSQRHFCPPHPALRYGRLGNLRPISPQRTVILRQFSCSSREQNTRQYIQRFNGSLDGECRSGARFEILGVANRGV